MQDLPPERVLCVDDDPLLLEGFQRQFRRQFRLHTALGPAPALALIDKEGPFAVVVSDLRMPGMDGIAFLSVVRERSPDSVRIMLTGQADLSAAVSAVNQGNIFRFLVKPCLGTILGRVIEAGIEQHRLITAEKQLTQHTLLGVLEVLVEVLGIVQPAAFSRACRLRRYVQQLVRRLALDDPWRFEAAAMLSQIGWITLQPELIEKVISLAPLSEEERARFRAHAEAASRLVGKIPRLETVALMVAQQDCPVTALPATTARAVRLGAQLLKICLDYDSLRQQGIDPDQCLVQMQSASATYLPEVFEALRAVAAAEGSYELLRVPFRELAPGMVLEQDLVARTGICLLGRGQEITPTVRERLMGFAGAVEFGTLIPVRVPQPR